MKPLLLTLILCASFAHPSLAQVVGPAKLVDHDFDDFTDYSEPYESFRVTAEVRLSELSKVDGDVVSLDTLKAANVVRRNMKRARIVLSGGIDRAVQVQGIAVTKGARAAIEAAGGSVSDEVPAAPSPTAEAEATDEG